MDVATVRQAAQAAKAKGASRFCMGAAWRSPNTHTEKGQAQFNAVLDMIREVKALGMEACVTLGMLTPEQALALKEAGLDAYNHNIDTSPDYYDKIITTRTFDDRLETLSHVRDAGMIAILGGMTPHPESVPINALVPVEGTPLGRQNPVDPMDIVRTIAVARVVMPTSRIRLSAGRESMSQETQILCLLVGANSFFYGDTLLTAPNQAEEKDRALLAMMGLPVKGTASEVVDEVCHA
jgi:biotin synthase